MDKRLRDYLAELDIYHKDFLRLSVISDPHLLPVSMIADTEDFRKVRAGDRKLFEASEPLFRKAVNLVREKNIHYLAIPGDLTKDGEYLSHQMVADILESFVADDPKNQVFVIPGNHDLNNYDALNFNYEGQKKTGPTAETSPKDFEQIYDKLVYKKALARYKESSLFKDYLDKINAHFDRSGEVDYFASGYLSYTSRINFPDQDGVNGLTVIALDTAIYSADVTESMRDDVQDTEGYITPELLLWAVQQAEEAKARQDMILVMAHHAFVPHFYRQEVLMYPYILKNWDRKLASHDSRINGKTPAEVLADNGMPYLLTGHMHAQDIAKMESSSGNRLYNIMTGSTSTYPSPIRHLFLNNEIQSQEDPEAHSIRIETELIESLQYLDHNDEFVSIDDLQAYASENIISAELIASIALTYLELPENKDLSIRDILALSLEVNRSELMEAIIDILKTSLGNKENPSTFLINFGILDLFDVKLAKVHSYYDEIETTDRYGHGKKLAIDIDVNLWHEYEFMIREENLLELVNNLFDQADLLLKDHQKIYDWIYRLAEAGLALPLTYDQEEDRFITFGNLADEVYLSFLKGDESQPNWLKQIVETFKNPNENLIGKILLQLAPVADKILEEMLSQLTYEPDADQIVEHDYKKRTRISRSHALRKELVKQIGDNLLETLQSISQSSSLTAFLLGFVESKKTKELEERVTLQELYQRRNKDIGDLIDGLTNEAMPEYGPNAYMEDNFTYLSPLKKADEGAGRAGIATDLDIYFRHYLEADLITDLELYINGQPQLFKLKKIDDISLKFILKDPMDQVDSLEIQFKYPSVNGRLSQERVKFSFQ